MFSCLHVAHPGTGMCAIRQSSQRSLLYTERQINADNEITRVQRLGVLAGLDMDQL